jgi:hypothetical protein
MIKDVATIEFIEKLGELAKNFGALLVRYAQRLEEQAKEDLRSRLDLESKSDKVALDTPEGAKVVINHIRKAQRDRQL